MDNTCVLNNTAKAAIDIAYYDILSKVSELPIYALLRGRKNPMILLVLSNLGPDAPRFGIEVDKERIK